MKYTSRQAGITLVEMIVVVSIIGILTAVLLADFGSGRAQARDVERKADLQTVAGALERHKLRYGRYPDGCNGPNNWSGQRGMGAPYECSSAFGGQYIIGSSTAFLEGDVNQPSIAEFLPTLPTDPGGSESDQGYVYTVSADGQTYKFMALGTVETEPDSEFARCDTTCSAAECTDPDTFAVMSGFSSDDTLTELVRCK